MPGQLSLLRSTWTAGVRGRVQTLSNAASPGPLHGPVENRNTSTDVKCTVNEREHRTNKVRQSAHQAGKEQPSAPSWVQTVEGQRARGWAGLRGPGPWLAECPEQDHYTSLVSISLCVCNKKARVSPNTRDESSSRPEFQIWSTRRSFHYYYYYYYCCPTQHVGS